jgi:hypothetical protein
MPLRVMHDANLPPWALGDSASHLRARLRLLAVLLTPGGLKPPARWRSMAQMTQAGTGRFLTT